PKELPASHHMMWWSPRETVPIRIPFGPVRQQPYRSFSALHLTAPDSPSHFRRLVAARRLRCLMMKSGLWGSYDAPLAVAHDCGVYADTVYSSGYRAGGAYLLSVHDWRDATAASAGPHHIQDSDTWQATQ